MYFQDWVVKFIIAGSNSREVSVDMGQVLRDSMKKNSGSKSRGKNEEKHVSMANKTESIPRGEDEQTVRIDVIDDSAVVNIR